MISATVFSFLLGLQYSFCHEIPKCCYANEQLTADLSSCVPASSNVSKNMTNNFSTFNKTITSQNLGSSNFSLQKNSCATIHGRSEILLNDRISLLDNGSLSFLYTTSKNGNQSLHKVMYPRGSYCVDQISSTNFYVENEDNSSASQLIYHSSVVIVSCPCSVLPCVQLCCPHNNVYLDGNHCRYLSSVPSNYQLLEFNNNVGRNFEIVRGLPHCDDYTSTGMKNFSILPSANAKLEDQQSVISWENYCIYFRSVGNDDEFQTSLMYCSTPISEFQETLYKVYFVMGSIFLAVTLLVYSLVSELRRTPYSWIMMSHVTCMFACYSMMAADKIIKPGITTWICSVTAYSIQFSFIAAMFWLNVMCFYIFRSFSYKYNYHTHRRISTVPVSTVSRIFSKNNIYLWYSVYVWGMTTSIVVATFLADHASILGKKMEPQIGLKVCWFKNGRAKFWFFYLPVSLVLLTNLVLFTFTVKGILHMQKESRQVISRDSKKHKGNKPVGATPRQYHKFILCAKLCALMGVTWIFEVLSWAIGGPAYYWYLTDAINSLRGVFIFFICCYKKKVFHLLLQHVHKTPNTSLDRVDENNASSIPKSATTRTTATDVANSDSYQLVELQSKEISNVDQCRL